MNNTDKEYLRLLDLILTKGRIKKNRTGVNTIGVFGAQARFDLQEGFPLLTTKKVFTKAIIHELLWFIRGDTNIKYLVDNDVHIWDGDCYRKYRDAKRWADYDLKKSSEAGIILFSKDEFINKIKTDDKFAAKWGDLGDGTYGQMWRAFPYYTEGGNGDYVDYGYGMQKSTHQFEVVDQLQKAIDTLKTNPDSRRIIVNAWHPFYVDTVALPPCHVLYVFGTEELTIEERYKYANDRGLPLAVAVNNGTINEVECKNILKKYGIPERRLNCMMMQRSLDAPLGGPFNVASYSLLLSMIAQVVNMVTGEFVWSIADAHIYENQIEGVKEQLKREPKKLPTLWLNPEVKDLFQFKFEDIRIEGYDPHPKIDFPLSTG